MKNYLILGLNPNATEEEIKRRYHSLAKEYHPDININSIEGKQMMQIINDAYDQIKKNNFKPIITSNLAEEITTRLNKSYFVLELEYNLEKSSTENFSLSFNDWIKRELEIQDLCDKLGKPRLNLEFSFKLFEVKYKDLNYDFMYWLKNELAIQELCDKLGKPKEELIMEYKLANPSLDFKTWLLINAFSYENITKTKKR